MIKKALMLSMLIPAQAFAADFAGGIGVFGSAIDASCASGCANVSSISEDSGDVGLVLTARLSFGRGFIQADMLGMPGSESGSGVTAGAGMHVGSFALSAGAGEVDAGAAATLDTYRDADNKDAVSSVYAEVAHTSGVFLRYTEYSATHDFRFSRLSPPSTVSRSAELDYEQAILGYRVMF